MPANWLLMSGIEDVPVVVVAVDVVNAGVDTAPIEPPLLLVLLIKSENDCQ